MVSTTGAVGMTIDETSASAKRDVGGGPPWMRWRLAATPRGLPEDSQREWAEVPAGDVRTTVLNREQHWIHDFGLTDDH